MKRSDPQSCVRHVRSVFALVGLSLYFGPFVVLKFIPEFGATSFAFYWTLSLMLVVPLLVLLTLWGASALVAAKSSGQSVGLLQKDAGVVGVLGLGLFAAYLVLVHALSSALPTGSYEKDFDSAVWQAPDSVFDKQSGASPRQKCWVPW